MSSDNSDSPPKTSGSLLQRTKTGCLTCRGRRVKCDERKPVCDNCRRGERECNWSTGSPKPPTPRNRSSKACEWCRNHKLKCTGPVTPDGSCERCIQVNIDCRWLERKRAPSRPSGGRTDRTITPRSRRKRSISQSTSSAPHFESDIKPLPTQDDRKDRSFVTHDFHTQNHSRGLEFVARPGEVGAFDNLGGVIDSRRNTVPSERDDKTREYTPPGPIEKRDLINLYFATVHYFDFLAFIPQIQYMKLLNANKEPRNLTLLMCASALRYAGEPTRENLDKADMWADHAISALLDAVYRHFGAGKLMGLLLGWHYNFGRGKFSSALLLGASAARMMQTMSLHCFDTAYPAGVTSKLSPLLTNESLRRAAWATFYADTVVDAGTSNHHLVTEDMMRLQLPCDERSFLSGTPQITCVLRPDPRSSQSLSNNLGMSAYLLRAAAARRRITSFAFGVALWDKSEAQLHLTLQDMEADIESIISGLPRQYGFNTEAMLASRDRLPMFILLHVLRYHLRIMVGRAKILVALRNPGIGTREATNRARRERIAAAIPMSDVVAEALRCNVRMGLQTGVFCYVSLEILLFEPMRLAQRDSSIDPKSSQFTSAITPLLSVLRDLAKRMRMCKILHSEACHRLLRCGQPEQLEQEDWDAFRTEFRYSGNDSSEFNFRDFKWVKLDRNVSRTEQHTAAADALLDLNTGPSGQTQASPRFSDPFVPSGEVSNGNLNGILNHPTELAVTHAQLGDGGDPVFGAVSNTPFELDRSWWGDLDGLAPDQYLEDQIFGGFGQPMNPQGDLLPFDDFDG